MPESASRRALVLEGPRRLLRHEIPLPDVDDDDALVETPADLEPTLATVFNPLGAVIRWAAFAQAIELPPPAATAVVAGTRGWATGAPVHGMVTP